MRTLKGAARSLLVYAKAHKRWVSVQKLANLAGLAMSLSLALQQVRTYTRSFYDAIATKATWADDVKLPNQALQDLQWFVDLDDTWNDKALWKLRRQW